jgi:hypothetical protein
MPFQTFNPRLSDEWTPARLALLAKLNAENKLSYAQIANELRVKTGSKFSRSAIIAKSRRAGFVHTINPICIRKITDVQALEIFQSAGTLKEIANRYSVSESHISNIKKGKSHKRVDKFIRALRSL